MSKIFLPQKNKQINGGKRFVFMSMGLLISGLISWGMTAVTTAVTIPNVIAAINVASVAYAAYEVGKEIVKAATPDELEKGWLIIKPRLLLSRLFTFQIHPLF